MIEFINVQKKFGAHAAVDELSFTIDSGELCVLIGPSGCGKTTTLRMINRMVECDAGEILIDGVSVKNFKEYELRRSIGYVIQSIGLLPHITVAENIGTVLRLKKWEKKKREARILELLDTIGLDPDQYLLKYPHQLSGGEAQRVGVARALAANPNIILMDEPFGAVDPLSREVLQTEFLSVQQKLRKTVIFVTHDLDEAIRLADKIAIMRDGNIVQYACPEDILAHPSDQFVRDFIGTSRALKRLACFSVHDHIREAPIWTFTDKEALLARAAKLTHTVHTIHWVADKDKKLMGFIKYNIHDVPEYIEVEANKISIPVTASLNEAISRILGQGMRAIPVIDDSQHIIGEIRLHDIETINQNIEL